jgi:hypothetical protein
MKTKFSARIVGGWLLLLIALMTGCGRSTTASGTVAFRGRPVIHGSVIFVGADKVAHSGVIAADGVYTVENLLPGSFSVAVVSRDPSHGRSILRGHKSESSGNAGPAGKAKSNGWFPLPSQYESAATSGLSCTLGAGKVKYDIELK